MIIFIERNIYDADNYREYFYDTDTSSFFYNVYLISIGSSQNFWSPDNTILATECSGSIKTIYSYVAGGVSWEADPYGIWDHFNESYLIITTESDSPDCCILNSSDFTIQKINNTDLLIPNGSIDITSGVYDMTEFEVSIDGGLIYNALPIVGLEANAYLVILKRISEPCTITFGVLISYSAELPVLDMQFIQIPDNFAPVFLPIIYQFQLIGNQVAVKYDGRAYIDALGNTDIITFLSSLPYIRIVGGSIYDGNVKVIDVDNDSSPTKFYVSNLIYSVDAIVEFILIDRQIFQLYGETQTNVFIKIADISVAADIEGIFSMRCEGFLQSLFEVDQPANGDDISLGRKFYCIPRDFDLFLGSDETNPILTAVYATVDISNYDDSLVPLGPSPINFIDPNTKQGYPIIFSYLNQDNQRVSNVRSGAVNETVTAGDSIYFQALPGNTYTIQWISPLSFTPYFSPSLPDWITVIASSDTSITIQIQTFTSGDVGDYGSEDYSSLDYSIDQLNAIVGCYTFQMFDGIPGSDEEPIFTFTVCIFPTQLLQSICGPNLFNIAWVNQEGGWNSYIFKGQKKHGRDISKVSTYKKLHELKKSSVEEVYDQVEVGFSMKSIIELAFITMLRSSIQAYLYNDASQNWDIPIVIDKANFPVYQTPFRQGEQQGSFIFKYATEVLIQRQ